MRSAPRRPVVRSSPGRRRQSRRRYRTAAEALDAYAKIRSEVSAGTHVPRAHDTLADVVATWLDGKRNLKVSTKAGYAHALEPVLTAYGALPVQRLSKADLDRLVSALVAGTLKRPRFSAALIRVAVPR